MDNKNAAKTLISQILEDSNLSTSAHCPLGVGFHGLLSPPWASHPLFFCTCWPACFAVSALLGLASCPSWASTLVLPFWLFVASMKLYKTKKPQKRGTRATKATQEQHGERAGSTLFDFQWNRKSFKAKKNLSMGNTQPTDDGTIRFTSHQQQNLKSWCYYAPNYEMNCVIYAI